MALRESCTNFPFGERTKAVWFVLIDWEKNEIKDYSGVSDKGYLVDELKKIVDSGNEKKYKLLGFWQGQYSTDGFNLNITESYYTLKVHFKGK